MVLGLFYWALWCQIAPKIKNLAKKWQQMATNGKVFQQITLNSKNIMDEIIKIVDENIIIDM